MAAALSIDVLGKMRRIAESVQGTARKMEERGKSSLQIGRIAGVIDEIADQTNLLALNAVMKRREPENTAGDSPSSRTKGENWPKEQHPPPKKSPR